MHRSSQHLPLGDVPLNLRDPRAFAAFSKELVNAVTCCEAVEQNPWTAQTALEVIMKAQRMSGHATVRAVSLPSEGCSQRFRVFEAKENGHTTFIVAFRSDRECYNDMVKKSKDISTAETFNNFQVHQGLWSRVVTMPLRSLPPQWRSQLRQGRHRLLLTGFSVGGVVAALATLQLLESEDPDIRDKICCYTFGTHLQGDQNYADYINYHYSSNFYHVIIDGDIIPGVLTLVNKVAENQPVVCSDVVTRICMMLALVAEVATFLILETTLPGAAGAILQQIDIDKLEKGIKSLIRTKSESRMPLPEFKFGGSLVQLNTQQSNNSITFVPLLGDGRVLEGIFSVEERDIASSDLEFKLGVHQIKTFRLLINGLDYSYINPAIKDASVDHSDKWTPPKGLSERLKSLDVNEMVKDRAGRAAKSMPCAAKSVSNVVKSPARYTGQQSAEEDDRPLSPTYFLQPYFDVEKPIQVWLHKDGNITIEVYGKNMVFGIHVLYLRNGKEILRVPCTEKYMPLCIENSEGSLMSLKEKMENMPLQFNTQGIEDLSLDDEKGCFRVQLAFGSQDVPAKKVNISWTDTLDVLCVAERFATLHPKKLIDLLLFWGTATAQAVCTTAYYAIQEQLYREHRKLADVDVQEMEEKLQNVPSEFRLLDQLLFLIDTRQISRSALDKLPPKMSETLSKTTNAKTSNVVVLYFSAGNESIDWTFSGCYARTIKRMITKEMLSERETAEQLSLDLDTQLAGPKEMVLAYLDHRFKYKEYAKEYSSKHINYWEKEKRIVKHAMQASADFFMDDVDSELLKALNVIIGLPFAALSAGFVGGAWWLYHAVSSPRRVIQNRPGLIDELQLTKQLADNWEKKLQAAALLFNCKIKPPSVACKLEFELYQFLINRIPEAGCFNFPSLDVKQTASISSSRYATVTTLQLANLAIAGARVYEIRKYLTERQTALGLFGSSRAGKSTFAKIAFHVDSQPGAWPDSRTRVMCYWTCPLPLTSGRNRQFTLIDFPGSTDYTAQDWYTRGQLFANVIVIVLKLDEINITQGVTLIRKACEARRQDTEVHVLVCLTKADQEYSNSLDEAESKNTTAAQLFTENFENYKRTLLDRASETAGNADHLAYISDNMHACCFRPSLQDETKQLPRELMNVNVKNVAWVKKWCVDKLSTINSSKRHSGTFS